MSSLKQRPVMSDYENSDKGLWDYLNAIGCEVVSRPNCEDLEIDTLYHLVKYNADEVFNHFNGLFTKPAIHSVCGAHCISQTKEYWITLAPNSYDYAFIPKAIWAITT